MSSGAGRASLGGLVGPRKRGNRHQLLGGSGPGRPRGGQGNRPPEAPQRDLAARERPVGSPTAWTLPLAGLWGRCLGSLAWVGGPERGNRTVLRKPESVAPGRGLRGCPGSRGLSADLGPDASAVARGNAMPKGLWPRHFFPALPPLSYAPYFPVWGRGRRLRGLDCGILPRLSLQGGAGVRAVRAACGHFSG